MGRWVRALTRRNLIATVAGVLLAGAPMLAFNVWLNGFVGRQSALEVDNAAQRAVAVANARLSQALSAIDDLAAAGVTACSPDAVETMRTAAFLAAPVKQIALVAPDGRVLCSDVRRPPGPQTLLATQAVPSKPGVFVDFIRVGELETMLRLRRRTGTDGTQIAAVVPMPLLLPQASMEGGPLRAFAGMVTRDGVSLGGTGVRPVEGDGTILKASGRSTEFGFNVEIAALSGTPPADYAILRWGGGAVSAALLIGLAAFLLLLPRRKGHDPVRELAEALKAGEFVPYYQPVVDIRSGQLRGAEVLVRWKKPDGSLVLPGAFIPLAESSGLIHEMTRQLMRRVCAEAGQAIRCRASACASPSTTSAPAIAGCLTCSSSASTSSRSTRCSSTPSARTAIRPPSSRRSSTSPTTCAWTSSPRAWRISSR